MQNVISIKSALRCFELVSSLKINFLKSKLAGFGLEERETGLNCKVMKTSFTYIGLPVGRHPRRLAFWDRVVDKLKGRLSRLKQNIIYFGGRITLIASVPSSILLFYLSFFRMPQGVINRCNKIMRNFLWGGTKDNNKVAWIWWKSVCKPKKLEGLGFRDWGNFNKTLLGNWRWRFLNHLDSLLGRVLSAKYSIPNGKGHVAVGGKFSRWWKDLLHVCYEREGDCWFDIGLKRLVGDGQMRVGQSFGMTNGWVRTILERGLVGFTSP